MIERLQVSNLRNLTQVNLQSTVCNVVIGANGSGKTSLLEAIFLLSRGKSFRHHQPKRYIQHHQNHATVYAKLNDDRTLAIQKQADATTILRLNQATVYNQSILTEQLPTLLIDPSTMDMLEQGSASRRQLLDWLVFHMKQGFHPQWVAYQRLLKQRNSLLKKTRQLTQVQLAELKSWDKGLSNHAALIHHYREQVFTEWQPYFAKSVLQLLPSYAEKLSLSYNAGYDTNVALDVQLNERLEQDLQLGYTRIGNHRADIHVHWRSDNTVRSDDVIDSQATNTNTASSNHEVNAKLPTLKEQAANVLSRGEKKLLITALRLSQLPLLLNDNKYSASFANNSTSRATPVVLLDDITAELDDRAIGILLSTLAQLPCQVFMTSLTDDIVHLVNELWSKPRLFHVKQGQIWSVD
ncbi:MULTISPECIES: DNA replication/repair protein RecF [Psychrobacter]|jgi:DNA replication and repair protein RecF|uniref:DNA replication and repair protein RecF n=2 Tax=Psychrobacter TaxID=497 RepID=A0A1G6YAH3_9GAMM|nr:MULTISPECIES: DNA replication and repair protein RecF [Psychrobacter]MDH4903633.1 DNA replication and repair protein RecF [Psychrobacter pocilloporae]GLR27956.1 DNA replication and repair protein RecF [Psychrobacter pacificensis]SDD87494.1 DNA replication and repair protein RecF [Psychrobacter pacificensis]|tara:strand:- start:3905 stop:5134 length:1230 start_codon:yes stop_codon:yes gene_type:complete